MARVYYSSLTGNTKLLAQELASALGVVAEPLPVSNADAQDLLFVGFWVDKGTCDEAAREFLSSLHGRRLALFGTMGMGSSREYVETLSARARACVPADNEVLGVFLCHGKMPAAVRARYVAATTQENLAEMRERIANFDSAAVHPDEADFAELRTFAMSIGA